MSQNADERAMESDENGPAADALALFPTRRVIVLNMETLSFEWRT